METSEYAFACEKACRSYKADGRELWTLTVRAGELPRGLKYGPNARYASLANKPAREMLRTLETDPSSFVLKNNGIMIVADGIRVDGQQVSLICKEASPDDDAPGHGVLNGGHTYLALTHALDADDERYSRVAQDAHVMVTVGIGIPEDDVWLISRARNTSEKVPLHALRELAGDWSDLKRHLPPAARKLVAFKPNDPEAPDAEYDVTDLLRRLVLLNNELFPAQDNKHPVQAYTSIGTLVRQYKQATFLRIAHLLPDAIRLEELVVRHWNDSRRGPERYGIAKANGVSTEPTTLLSGLDVDLRLPAPFVLPVIAAFRVFVRSDGTWAKTLDELWDSYGPRSVRALWDTYREQGRGAAVFGRSRQSWAAACDLTKSAAIQMRLINVT
jgi:hypothetical protein